MEQTIFENSLLEKFSAELETLEVSKRDNDTYVFGDNCFVLRENGVYQFGTLVNGEIPPKEDNNCVVLTDNGGSNLFSLVCARFCELELIAKEPEIPQVEQSDSINNLVDKLGL